MLLYICLIKLSTLKLDLASQGKRVDSYNPPVCFMQELQDENQRLRKQLGSGKYGCGLDAVVYKSRKK